MPLSSQSCGSLANVASFILVSSGHELPLTDAETRTSAVRREHAPVPEFFTEVGAEDIFMSARARRSADAETSTTVSAKG